MLTSGSSVQHSTVLQHFGDNCNCYLCNKLQEFKERQGPGRLYLVTRHRHTCVPSMQPGSREVNSYIPAQKQAKWPHDNMSVGLCRFRQHGTSIFRAAGQFSQITAKVVGFPTPDCGKLLQFCAWSQSVTRRGNHSPRGCTRRACRPRSALRRVASWGLSPRPWALSAPGSPT